MHDPASSLAAVYPPGPSAAPPKLSEASPSYKRRAWIALAVLVTFGLTYASLLGWFGYTLYRIGFEFSRGRFQLPLIGVALLAGCLALFLSKALFAVKRTETSDDLEIKRADQPLLWAFLERLADEAGAPRPHRVFLSGAVNAGVFYDVSVKNLRVWNHGRSRCVRTWTSNAAHSAENPSRHKRTERSATGSSSKRPSSETSVPTLRRAFCAWRQLRSAPAPRW